jgi:hypothetical protein
MFLCFAGPILPGIAFSFVAALSILLLSFRLLTYIHSLLSPFPFRVVCANAKRFVSAPVVRPGSFEEAAGD